MFEKEKVEDVIELTRREHWPYPIVFNMLIEAGVTHYETHVALFETVYSGEGGELTERGPKNFKAVPAAAFSVDELKRAIVRNQRRETDYPQFLKDIAAAGVHTYHVDMEARTVTYRGGQGETHVESVPQP
jgi:uncharacterized protein YbcV (DUF1398 family)